MQCIDERRLKDYTKGKLAPAEMVEVSAHLHACSACRARLAGLSENRHGVWSLGLTVLGVDDCPEYEQLSAYVSDGSNCESGEWIERHLRTCELCAHDVETLQAVRSRATLAPEIEVHPGTFGTKKSLGWVPRWRWLSAGAVAGAALATFLFISQPSGVVHKPNDVVALNPEPEVTAPMPPRAKTTVEATPDVRPDKVSTPVDEHKSNRMAAVGPNSASDSTRAPVKAVRVVELKDGGITVERDNGKFRLAAGRNLEAQVAKLVQEKINKGSVPPSFRVAMVAPLRFDEQTAEIKIKYPASGIIADSRPVFEWEPVDGAIAYRVEVFDLEGNPALSQVTESASFQPSENLSGGGYRWMVWAQRGSMTGWEPSMAEVFRILTAKENTLIAKARESGSHLVLGTVYESLGMKREATEEFSALKSSNPDSPLADKLLSGVPKD